MSTNWLLTDDELKLAVIGLAYPDYSDESLLRIIKGVGIDKYHEAIAKEAARKIYNKLRTLDIYISSETWQEFRNEVEG